MSFGPFLKKIGTKKVVCGLVGAALLYEAYTVMDDKDEDTISETVWRHTKMPLIPFSLGFLVGHFVWQSDKTYSYYWNERD